jgi:hypothetical protein
MQVISLGSEILKCNKQYKTYDKLETLKNSLDFLDEIGFFCCITSPRCKKSQFLELKLILG